jgi:hypothetical protein
MDIDNIKSIQYDGKTMEILYKYAEDKAGKIININSATEGTEYFCPGCKQSFILKHGKIRQHHFAHKNPSPECTGEGYLHKTFKKYLLQLLKQYINNKNSLDINFLCNICKTPHNYNLLLNICDAQEEYTLGDCRPDIVLINNLKRIPIIIEIVDTHDPEQNVIEYCQKTSTILIIIKLDSIDDLENIDNKIKNPTFVFLSNKILCPLFKQWALLKNQRLIIPNYHINNRGPKIDQIEAKCKRKQHYAIKNYYKNRKRK